MLGRTSTGAAAAPDSSAAEEALYQEQLALLLRPRVVSFNRDVHVKRIVPSAGSRLTGAVSGVGSGEGIVVASPVRKQRLSRSKQELAAEAARIIHQVDRLDNLQTNKGTDAAKFYTLPSRKRHKDNADSDLNIASLDRRTRRKSTNSSDLLKNSIPPKKPPRTFAQNSPPKPTVFDLFKKSDQPPKRSNIRRSVSDASSLKSKGNDSEITDFDKFRSHVRTKKQLSPIIEVNPREDYFADNKENINAEANKHDADKVDSVKAPSRKKWNKPERKNLSRENIKEIFKEPEDPPNNHSVKSPGFVIIDLDKAKKISKPNIIKEKFSKKLKSLTGKNKNKSNKQTPVKAASEIQKPAVPTTLPKAKKISPIHDVTDKYHTAPRIKSTIQALENPTKRSPMMIHSSQQPVDKLPLTKGRTVDSMVKRLSTESTSPPPKTNIMIAPTVSMQHNNNQPFSYIRGLSPDRSPTNPNSPVIYAQVVCSNNGLGSKQTVHAAYTNGKKHLPHSDSDEGFGYEEFSRNKTLTNFGDDYYNEDIGEFPITPKYNYNHNGFTSYDSTVKYIDSSGRGRGDGMDAKRRESIQEQIIDDSAGPRKDLSARREMLESRINRRFNDKHTKYVSDSPIVQRYHNQRSGSASPIGFTKDTRTNYTVEEKKRYNYDYEPKSLDSQVSDYRSSPENEKRHYEASQDYRNKYTTPTKQDYFKSTPDLRYDYKTSFDRTDSERKDKFGDSGIENDFRRDSGDNFKRPKRRDTCNDSEDEGFASSLLIASERQHTEDLNKKKNREVEDRGYSLYRNVEGMDRYGYAPRERSIDDGSHFDPRIDRNLDNGNGVKMDKKPPKAVKRSSLEKVKQLFTRDSKKKKEKASGMVREESLRARYNEYKGPLMEGKYLRKSTNDLSNEYENSGRRRLSTPSPTRQGRDGGSSDSASRNGKGSNVTTGTKVTTITTGTHSSWFKSLDRLARKKTKKGEKDGNLTSTEDERARSPASQHPSAGKPTKSLRFFGDTDVDSSNDSARYEPQLSSSPSQQQQQQQLQLQQKRKSALKSLGREQRARSQSSRELHNISEELGAQKELPQAAYRNGVSHHTRPAYKSMLNISNRANGPNVPEDVRGSRNSLLPPKSPIARDVPPRGAVRGGHTSGEERRPAGFRRKNEVNSSVESSTEGDSSQQSQRSVVYLHAATVGDIPGPGYLRPSHQRTSREDITSHTSSTSRLLQPQTKTLSRSFSVLAPWKPRHYRDSMEVDYSADHRGGGGGGGGNTTANGQRLKNGRYEQRSGGSKGAGAGGSGRRVDSSTMVKKKAQQDRETRRSQQSLLGGLGQVRSRSRSKENIAGTLKRASDSKGSSSSLYKKKDRQPKENQRYNSRDDKAAKLSAKSMSVESLGSSRPGRRSREENREVSRSVSMPRNPEKSAGWFNLTRKSNKKSLSTHRL